MKLLMQFIEYDFMNKWYTIVLLAIICGCSSSKSGILDDIEIIPVDVDNISPDASSFIEKIEIVPLETTDSSLIGGYRKTMYNKCMDMYAIYGKNQIISTFQETAVLLLILNI